MDGASEPRSFHWVGALRTFLGPPRAVVERCEICNAALEHDHPHLIEPETRRLLCACQGCAILFAHHEAKRYRRVSNRAVRLSDFQLSDSQWGAFQIPVDMAFFFRSSTQGRVLAMYPGPAGATESKLDLQAWTELAAVNPVLEDLEEDTEALLINRVNGARDYFRISIDRCYELGGLIRRRWRGLSGGEGVREVMAEFFQRLGSGSDTQGAQGHA